MNKRPMLIITANYIIGIIMGLYFKINIALFVVCIFYLVITSLKIFLFKFGSTNYILNKKTIKYIICNSCNQISLKLILSCFITIIISTINIYHLERNFECRYVDISEQNSFIGTIVDIKKDSDYFNIYILKIENINNRNFRNTNILLKVKKNRESKLYKYGDKISGTGNFEKPSKRRNYKGFDYSRYLKTEKIYMICNTECKNIKVLGKNNQFVGDMWINNLRNDAKNNLLKLLPKEKAYIAIALLLGDTNMLDKDQRETFSNASLSHILAISGMHVAYVIVACRLIFRKFDKRIGKYIFIIILLFFCKFTGESSSVERAVIMSVIAISTTLVYRKSDTINNISISALIILIKNPYDILNLGFQLSFLGTIGIVLFNAKISNLFNYPVNYIKNTKIKRLLSKVISLLTVSLSANVMIIPILAYNYNTISFTFIISNILVAPILGIMCFLGYITISISIISINLANFFAYGLRFCIHLFELIAEFGSNIDFLRFMVTTPNIVFILMYYIVIFYLFYFYKKSHNKILYKVISILIIIFIIVNSVLKHNLNLKIYFVDVGQGDCTLIVTRTNKTILIDGGGSENSSYDVGKNVLVPYLLDRGVKTIDYMIFSHFDSDHAKGLLSVMECLKVKNAIVSKQGKESDNYNHFLKLSKNKKIKISYIQARR